MKYLCLVAVAAALILASALFLARETKADSDELLFIACVPSFQECAWSCPGTQTGTYLKLNDLRCRYDQLPHGCYCKMN